MKTTLGLDLGTNSIGWALVDEEGQKILDAGVRIFQEGVIKKTIGSGDKEESQNAARRMARQMRRQNYRRRLRRIKLLQTLIEHRMCPLKKEDLDQWRLWDKEKKKAARQFPHSPNFEQWIQLNPYTLRKRALSENLSRHELGRVFYHLIQRRGFLSNRKSSDEEKGSIFKGKDLIKGIDDTKALLQEQTLGAALHAFLHPENKAYKRVFDKEGKEQRARGRYTQRDMYIAEFSRIWERQAAQLGLDKVRVEHKTLRYLNGNLKGKHNQKKLDYLKKIKKVSQLQIKPIPQESDKEGQQKQALHCVTTIEEITLKECLGGQIWKNEEGEYHHHSQNSILFYQRPLRSQKNLLGHCSFEPSKTPCPISHPDFEEWRARQLINNIQYGGQRLSEQERERVWDYTKKQDKTFNFQKIIKLLKMTQEQFNYADDVKISPCPITKHLTALFEQDILQSKREEIWHCFYFFDDNDLLLQKLEKSYGLKPVDFNKAKKINPAEGYANVSLKAIRNMLPFLRQGYQYSDASLLGGVKNAFCHKNPLRWDSFKDSHDAIIKKVLEFKAQDSNKVGDVINNIKSYLVEPDKHYGFTENDKAFKKLYHHSQEVEKKELKTQLPSVENLRNPIVQQGLGELKRLVNQLVKKYQKKIGQENFHFDRIRIELGRDLKNGKKARQTMTDQNKENKEKNDRAQATLSEHGLKPSRENMHKVRLFQEIQERHGTVACPYTGKSIGLSSLLGKNNLFQVEHILPYSRSLNDSLSNKTLCESNFNREKGSLTPHEFYLKNPTASLWGGVQFWQEIETRAFSLLPYRKASHFVRKKADDKKDDFLSRQLNDMRYISKKAKEILTQICDDVRVSPGTLTAELRRLWGLNKVLNPMSVFDLPSFSLDAENPRKRLPHWVLLGKDGKPEGAGRLFNEKPQPRRDEIILFGSLEQETFRLKMKGKTQNIPCPQSSNGEKRKDGDYWARLRISEPQEFYPVFNDADPLKDRHFQFKGPVKGCQFSHDRLAKKAKAPDCEDGYYWAQFPVKGAKLQKAGPKKENPSAKGDQWVGYGELKDGQFRTGSYSLKSPEAEGKYHVILNLDLTQGRYKRWRYSSPSHEQGSLILEGDVDHQGLFHPDSSPEAHYPSQQKRGRYWARHEIQQYPQDLTPHKCRLPSTSKEQKLTEADIWTDEKTGELRFEPKKNRDDHRHHAIDALAIALNKDSYLQKMSRRAGAHEKKRRQQEHELQDLHFPLPWESFLEDVQKTLAVLLVSFRQKKEGLVKNKNHFSKQGRRFLSQGLTVRGALHNESVYGKRRSPQSEEAFHLRKPLSTLKNNKHVGKVVDQKIRELIEKHLEEQCGVDVSKPYTLPKHAFFHEKTGEPRLFLPNKRGEKVPIKKIRMREKLRNAAPLKADLNQYVDPQNNHHVLIYRDGQDVLQESSLTLGQVVERQRQGQPVFQLPPDGRQIVCSLQKNDLFLLGLSDQEFADQQGRTAKISACLYRVQKISAGDYVFRYHWASTNENECRIQSFKVWESWNPIKVRLSILGDSFGRIDAPHA